MQSSLRHIERNKHKHKNIAKRTIIIYWANLKQTNKQTEIDLRGISSQGELNNARSAHAGKTDVMVNSLYRRRFLFSVVYRVWVWSTKIWSVRCRVLILECMGCRVPIAESRVSSEKLWSAELWVVGIGLLDIKCALCHVTGVKFDKTIWVCTRSWSRYVQMCACYLTIQRTTLVGAFEIRFRTLVYEQLETRETLTLTLTGNCLNLTTGTQVVRCTVS